MNLQGKPFELTEEQIKWVVETRTMLTDRQKVGQLFCVMGQDYAPEELEALVREYGVGGVLFRPEPAEAIRGRFAALDKATAVPLLKAANLEEGGSGGLSDGTFFGWPMTVAATGDTAVCEKFAQVCVAEGADVGINWTFSPVCDIDRNFQNPIVNVRSFGGSVEVVERFASAYVRCCQESGVAACAKHFPGDGVDFRDQHLHPTYNSLSAQEWWQSDGRVYQTLIGQGLLSVMVGHIAQPVLSMEINPSLSFEDCLPASLSPELLQGVLRGRLGFEGLITTDATIMGGFTQAMARREAIPQAIMAGNDMLVFNTDFYEDHAYLMEALADGRLTGCRLEEAVTRVLALKAKVALTAPVPPAIDPRAWRAECAQRSVTLVKNCQPGLLPVTPDKYPKIRLIPLGNDKTPDGSMTAIAAGFLRADGFEVEIFDEGKAELHGTAGLSPRRLTLYLANLEAASNQTAVRIFWCKKHALNAPRHPQEEPSAFVSFANPYHLQDVPRVKTYINAYSCHRDTILAALEKLTGMSAFGGVSPVEAFCGLPDTRL